MRKSVSLHLEGHLEYTRKIRRNRGDPPTAVSIMGYRRFHLLLGGRRSAIGDLQSAIAAPWAFLFGNIAIFMKMVILAKMEDNDNDRWPYRL